VLRRAAFNRYTWMMSKLESAADYSNPAHQTRGAILSELVSLIAQIAADEWKDGLEAEIGKYVRELMVWIGLQSELQLLDGLDQLLHMVRVEIKDGLEDLGKQFDYALTFNDTQDRCCRRELGSWNDDSCRRKPS
jgi:hypothetical protein